MHLISSAGRVLFSGFPTRWLYKHRIRLEASNFEFREKKDCTIYVLRKRKVLISCMVTVQLICGYVFACAKIRFSHDAAHLKLRHDLLESMEVHDFSHISTFSQVCNI